jgi:malonyl-CoA O-methyltransferase
LEYWPRKQLKRLWQNKKQPVSVDVLTGYAQWAKSYPAYAHNPLMAIEEQAMLSLLPDDLTEKVCLDLACGSGRYMWLLQARQAERTFGLDYSPNMLLQVSNPKFAEGTQGEIENPKLVCGPFLALPFAADTFDLITCGLAIGHEKNLRHTLAEISRVLQAGGTVVYSDFHPFGTLSGWQRSFTTTHGDTFHLEHYLHLYSDHLQACQAAGLTINAVLEPIAGEHAPPGFEQMPVVLVLRAAKIKGDYFYL